MKSAGELILYKDFSGTDEEIFYPMASIIVLPLHLPSEQ